MSRLRAGFNRPACGHCCAVHMKSLRTDKHDNIVCNDMFKLLVWECYAWSAQQFFQVKDRKGKYRDNHENWNQYSWHFPLWRLSYSIIPYIRMKF